MRKEPELRFAALCEEDENGCWLWVGFIKANGYAQFRPGGVALPVYAHRWAYEHFVGSIPQGKELDHLCRVRCCVNPAHLEPVTRQENLLRGDTIPARLARRTRCNHGHRFTEENTTLDKDGTRRCLACKRRRSKEAYHRAKGR